MQNNNIGGFQPNQLTQQQQQILQQQQQRVIQQQQERQQQMLQQQQERQEQQQAHFQEQERQLRLQVDGMLQRQQVLRQQQDQPEEELLQVPLQQIVQMAQNIAMERARNLPIGNFAQINAPGLAGQQVPQHPPRFPQPPVQRPPAFQTDPQLEEAIYRSIQEHFPNQAPPIHQNVREVEKFSELRVWKEVIFDKDEHINWFHIDLYRASRNSSVKELATFIKEELSAVFYSSILEKPSDEMISFLSTLCPYLLNEKELPEWFEEQDQMIPEEKSIFSIGSNLIQQCIDGIFPQDFDQDLSLLQPLDWSLLEDSQGRSPLHIILSHFPFTDEHEQALYKLVKLCPFLLTRLDTNHDTPFDIIFRRNDQIDLINLLLATVDNKDNDLEFDGKVLISRMGYLCYAKKAKEIIEKLDLFLNMQGISADEVDAIPNELNPLHVCRELKKEDLANFFIYEVPVQNLDNESSQATLITRIVFRDPSLKSDSENSPFPATHSEEAKALHPYLVRLIETGHKEWVVSYLNNQINDFNFYASFTVKKIFYIFSKYPELFAGLDINLKNISESDLVHIIHSMFHYSSRNKLSGLQKELICQVLTASLGKNVFLLNEETLYWESHQRVTDLYAVLIPLIFTTDSELVDKIIEQYIVKGKKELLFYRVCSAILSCKDPSFLTEEQIDDLLKKLQEKVPVEIDLSEKVFLHRLANFAQSNYSLIIFKYVQNAPHEQITELLNYRDSSGNLPIEYLIDFRNINFTDPKYILIENFLSFSNNISDIKNSKLIPLILYKPLFGDSNSENLSILDTIDPQSLIVEEGEKIKLYWPPFSEMPYEKIKEFFAIYNTLPTGIFEFPKDTSAICYCVDQMIANNDEESYEILLKITRPELTKDQIFSYLFKEFNDDFLKKVLAQAEIHDFSFPDNHEYFGSKLINNPEIIEILFDKMMYLPFLVQRLFADDVKDHNIECLRNFSQQMFYKLTGEQSDSVIYKGYTLSFEGEKQMIYKDGVCILEGIHTAKMIDSTIESDINAKKILFLRDTKNIKRELNLDSLFLDDNALPPNIITFISPVKIKNDLSLNRFIVYYTDFETMALQEAIFSHTQENVLSEMKEFVQSRSTLYKQKRKALTKHLENIDVLVTPSYIQFPLGGESPGYLRGIPTVEKLNSYLKYIEEIKQKNFNIINYFGTGTTFNNLIKYCSGSYFVHLSYFNLKLFTFKGSYPFFMHHNEENDITSAIERMESIIEEIKTCSLKKENGIDFNNEENLNHRELANIDLDGLNKLIISFEEGIRKKRNDYVILKENMDLLVSALKTKKKIKELDSEEVGELAIKVSHTLKKLQEVNNLEELERFVIELACAFKSCGWNFAEKCNLEYIKAFHLFSKDDSKATFHDLYKNAILQTLDVMRKFAISPRSQAQSIHLISSLRKFLKDHIKLPPDPINGDLEDIYTTGEDDFPKDSVFNTFQAFFIPILVQTFLEETTGSNYDKISLIVDDFTNLIPMYDDILQDEVMVCISEHEENFKEVSEKLASANSDLNDYLTTQDYILQKNLQEESAILDEKICVISRRIMDAKNEITEMKNSPFKEKEVVVRNDKSGFFPFNVPVSDKTKYRKEQLKASIKNLEKDEEELKANRELYKKGINYTLTQHREKIRKIKVEEESVLNNQNRDRNNRIKKYCKRQGWLTHDKELDIYYFTAAGIVKYLQIKCILTQS